MSDILPDSPQLIQDKPHEKKFFSLFPNIIDDLDLNPYEYRLYGALKRMAGEKGECFCSNKFLSKKTGISLRQLQYTKKSLSLPRKELNGKSLIQCIPQKNEKNLKTTSIIILNNIWDENMIHYLSPPKKNTACDPSDSKNVCDVHEVNSKNVCDVHEVNSKNVCDVHDMHVRRAPHAPPPLHANNIQEEEQLKKNNNPQTPFGAPPKKIPASQNAAAPFKFSKNILQTIQAEAASASKIDLSVMQKLRSELIKALKDPEKVEIGITWYLSLSKNRRERILNPIGSIIEALRGSYAQEKVKSLQNAKEREIEAFMEKEKKRQRENRRKIEEPVENKALFNESAKKLSSIEGIRTEGDTIYYDKADSVKNEHGIFQARMPNGRIYYSPTKCISCRFKFSISKKEFQAALNWFLDFFNPLLNPV